MPIEINYFAWEENKGKDDIFSSVYGFVTHGYFSRIKSGNLVCQLVHARGWYPFVSYELLADNENTLISKLNRIVFDYHHIYDWRVFDVSSELANALHSALRKIPKFPGGITDTLIPPKQSYFYHDVLRVSTQPNIDFKRDWSGANFAFDNSEDANLLDDCIQSITEMGEECANGKLWYRDRIEDTFEPFRLLFRKKMKHARYQGKWSTPPPPEYSPWDDQYQIDRNLLNTFYGENLRDNWKRQLDFKFYLPGFMRLLALHNDKNKHGAMFIFEKISETDFPNWDTDEQQALHNYFMALWQYILVYFPPLGIDAYTFTHGVQLTGADVTPYVQHWKQAFHRVEVSRHLAGYIQSLFEQYVGRGEVVLDEVPKILQCWLQEIADGDYFLKRFLEYDGVRPLATEFADASDMLKALMDVGL